MNRYNQLAAEIEADIIPLLKHGIGSSPKTIKTYLFAWLIEHFNMQTTLDIGVYYGCSLLPQAYAHKKYSGGHVYAVDPYTAADFKQKIFPRLDGYADATDFDEIFNTANETVEKAGCKEHVTFIRQRSDQAINYFIDYNIYFDLIHVDGNHDAHSVNSDARLYLPRLKDNGFLILDDVIFPSVCLTHSWLTTQKELTLVYEQPGSIFSIFQKTDTPDQDFIKLLQEINK